MIDGNHGVLSFSRQKRDEDGVPVPEDTGGQTRVVITGAIPPYIARQMETSEPPRPLPPNHPAMNPNAQTIRHPMFQVNGEWTDVETLAGRIREAVQVRREPDEPLKGIGPHGWDGFTNDDDFTNG